MEITCPSCSTVYEVRPSQLTGRGVNFRCSQCGYVFKVKKNQDPVQGPLQVQIVSSGEVRAYDERADIQRAIIDGDLSPRDQLSERGGPWESLGQMSDFAPFFMVLARSRETAQEEPSFTDFGEPNEAPTAHRRPAVSTQDQPAVGRNTRTFSPLSSWEESTADEVPPHSNLARDVPGDVRREQHETAEQQHETAEQQHETADLFNRSSRRAGTARFSVLDPEQFDPPPTESKPAPSPPRQPRADASLGASASATASAGALDDDEFSEKPTSIYQDDIEDEELLDFEEFRPKRRAGAWLVFFVVLLVGAGVAAFLLRDRIGATPWGAQLPFFGDTHERRSADGPMRGADLASTTVDIGQRDDLVEHNATELGEGDAGIEATAGAATTAGDGIVPQAEGQAELPPEAQPPEATPPTDAAQPSNRSANTDDDRIPSAETTETPAPPAQQHADAAEPGSSVENPARSPRAPASDVDIAEEPPAASPPSRRDSERSAEAAARDPETPSRTRTPAPNDFDGLTKLGDSLQVAGDSRAAHDAYSRALEANPRYMPALFGIAAVERSMGQRNAAIERYRTILRINATGGRADQARNALRGLGVDVD